MEGAQELGFVFETRTPEYVVVDVLGTKERYEVLNVLEFTSARKRMSVIVRTPQGQIKLYCKGADTVSPFYHICLSVHSGGLLCVTKDSNDIMVRIVFVFSIQYKKIDYRRKERKRMMRN